MKTLYHTSKTSNVSNLRDQIRLGLTLAGVITAIICSLMLFRDSAPSRVGESGLPFLTKTTKLVSIDFTKEINLPSSLRFSFTDH